MPITHSSNPIQGPKCRQPSPLLKFIFQSDFDKEVTLLLISILGQINHSSAVEPLITKLNDDDLEVRKVAIKALSNLQDSRAIEPLIAKLDDDDKKLRMITIWALGNLHNFQAVNPLTAKLGDEDPDVRSEVLGALAKICRAQVVDRRLLSNSFIYGNWVAPKEPITEERVAKAASKLKLTPEEVRQRYEDLARVFNLTLAWQAQ